MLISIRHTKRKMVDEDGDELAGYCWMKTPNRISIQISERHNRSVNKYAGTTLHELIHAWVDLLELKGFKTDEVKEEQFVEKVEQIVVRNFTKTFGGNNARANSRPRTKR